MSKKLEIDFKKGDHASFLMLHTEIWKPSKDFIQENIKRTEVKVDDPRFKDIPVHREVAAKNYKITITIEEEDDET